QNVNAWRDESNRGLEKLIEALAVIPGLARIRYTTSHPNDMTDGLIAAHRDVPQLMPFLHLPVQAGNDRVLKAMNRSHTADSYLRVLDQVRVARPDIALSGDFIVGFPGETDAEFEDTMRIVEQVGYAQCFSFKYSARPGTPAATLDNQVPVDVMDERLSRLQAALIASQLAFNQATVGRKCAVLVERTGRHPGQWVGKSPWLQSVYFSGAAEIGDLVEVELTEAGTHSLAARLLEPATA
ncbi:MAG: radical SAM protein, partial [Novosphingobium sp.]